MRGGKPSAVPARSDGGHAGRPRRDHDPRSSASATSSATGASACCRLAAAASTRRGRWRRRRKSARSAASTSKPCGATTGSSCGFLMWTSRRTSGCCCRIRTRCRRSSSGSWARPRCSRPSSAKTPPVLCCCRSGGPACARRSGSSASVRPTCWRSPRSFGSLPGAARDLSRVPPRLLRHARARIARSRTSGAGSIRVATVDSERPSPFAASLLFSYVASFLYDGDAPLAERRAQALAVDQAQLRDLDRRHRSCANCSTPTRMQALERELQRLDPRYRAKSADGVHDMLLSLGDLSARRNRGANHVGDDVAASAGELVRAPPRAAGARGGPTRYIAVEDAARYRDALGVPLPAGVPESLLVAAPDPLGNLAGRYARTHAPFAAARRSRSGTRWARRSPRRRLRASSADGPLVEGEFRPAAQAVSGPTPACCVSCGGDRSRSFGRRPSRSIKRCSDG